jgi:dihydrofolate reductase
MIFSIIAAMAENRVIGRDNRMPWDLPSDRRHFHATTRGHPVILGRKTFESIGRPLKDRKNIVLTRQKHYRAEGVVIVHDLESAFDACAGADEAFVCGGEEVFHETIELVDRIYLTVIHRPVQGDSCFPGIPTYFKEVERREVADVMPYAVVVYQRIKKSTTVPVH